MDFSQLDQAQNNVNTTTQTANDFASGGLTLADQLRQAIGSRFGDSGIAQQAGVAQGNLLANSNQTRSHILDLINAGTILSPTQQNSIMSNSNAAALAPVVGNNILQQAQFGTLQDLINAGTNAYNAQTTKAQGAEKLAQDNYDNILKSLTTKQTLTQNEAMGPLDILYKKALINQANKSATGATATERLSEEKKKIIQEANKLPEASRKAYILANGYNPNDADFSGLFTQTGLDLKNASDLKALGIQDQYTLGPSGTLIPKPTTQKEWWNPFSWFQ